MNATDNVTQDELSAAYRESGLHRMRYGLARALQTPSIYASLRITALVLRRKTQRENDHGRSTA